MKNNTLIYILRYSEDGSIYAISDNNKDIKSFLKIRKKSLFKKDYILLNNDEYKDFHSDCLQNQIVNITYNIDNEDIEVYMTRHEYLDVEAMHARDDVNLTATANIDPNIFNKKVLKYLSDISYIDAWTKWKYGSDGGYDKISFLYFLKLYGSTINFKNLERRI